MKIIPEKIDIINDIEPNEAVSKIIFSVVSKGANSAFSEESFLFPVIMDLLNIRLAQMQLLDAELIGPCAVAPVLPSERNPFLSNVTHTTYGRLFSRRRDTRRQFQKAWDRGLTRIGRLYCCMRVGRRHQSRPIKR